MTSDADHARPAGGTRPPGRRPALTREQILTAALQIIDEDGVEALTMRRLGQALDRNPMAIYRHAADKDALLDGVVEHVAAELVAPRRPDRNGDGYDRTGRAGRATTSGKRSYAVPRTPSDESPWPTPTWCPCY